MREGATLALVAKEGLGAAFSVYQGAIAAMHRQNIFHWGDFYPAIGDLEKDIASGDLYCVLSPSLEKMAYFALNKEAPAEYGMAHWALGGPYMVLHRLCVHSEWMGKGVGASSVLLAEGEARRMGAEGMRLDAFTENPIAMRLYEKLGYERRGIIQFPGRTGDYCLFEKRLA
jgi:ribosomal protein S18 acetylase RimI-like enzyme